MPTTYRLSHSFAKRGSGRKASPSHSNGRGVGICLLFLLDDLRLRFLKLSFEFQRFAWLNAPEHFQAFAISISEHSNSGWHIAIGADEVHSLAKELVSRNIGKRLAVEPIDNQQARAADARQALVLFGLLSPFAWCQVEHFAAVHFGLVIETIKAIGKRFAQGIHFSNLC